MLTSWRYVFFSACKRSMHFINKKADLVLTLKTWYYSGSPITDHNHVESCIRRCVEVFVHRHVLPTLAETVKKTITGLNLDRVAVVKSRVIRRDDASSLELEVEEENVELGAVVI